MEKRQGKDITWSRARSYGAQGTLWWHSRVSSPLTTSPWPDCPATGAEEPNADPMGLSPSWGPLITSTATFPLPTVINKATTPSLQDPSRKIHSSPHHVHLSLPGAQPFGLVQTGGEATGFHADSPCAASAWDVGLQHKHPASSSPPPCLQRNGNPQQTSLTLCLQVTPTSKLVAQLPQQLQGPLRGWVTWGAAGNPCKALPHSVCPSPQMGPAVL